MSESEGDDEKVFSVMKKKSNKGTGFSSFPLSKPILNALTRKGYKNPTPIQRKTIPLILDGKDVIGMSRTGSGKTLAFLVPIVERIYHDKGKSGCKAVILSPTRELAMQTHRFFQDLNREVGLKVVCLLGGDALGKHFTAMHTNPDVIIATPGRLLHVLVEMDAKLPEVKHLVMDECDRLFEMGFEEQVTEIVRRLPDHRQTLLFSATLPQSVVNFVKNGSHDPVLIRLDVESKLSENLTSCFLSCRESDKLSILLYLLKEVTKKDEMTLIFAATRHHVEYLQTIIEKAGIVCTHVYSALDQEARRSNIELFRRKKIRTMIVTDVAARGIDIPFLDNVINYNFPSKPKLYVHRVGRVARAGRSGTAYSLVSADELPYLHELHLFLGQPLKLAKKDVQKETGILGKVPQTLIDIECDSLNKWHESYSDLEGLKKVCENATKQYVKTRSIPSSDSISKAKEISQQDIAIHPIFRNYQPEEEEVKRTDFMSSLKGYKPKSTIFEIGPNKKEFFNVMKIKRKHHDKLVEKTKTKNEKMGEEDSKGEDYKDDKFFLPYRSDEHFSEKGLEIDKGFSNPLDDAVFDVGGDDQKTMMKSKNGVKWDRKKKKFVGKDSSDPKKKKIKTESGVWISASYKSDIYKKWQEGNKIREADEEDDRDAEETERRDQAIEKLSKRSKKDRRPSKPELKSKADLLKERMQKDKKRKFMEWRRRQKSNKKSK
ncbi:ATP-dependent RNA helicase DDX54 [Brevipalpus obovatus]|uniref:ATP-dependent RNA helicase DDX54 n=1 Tax=Brevipalpus obovatus TaxID=246614 RepID=UPI003D9DB7DC